MSQYTLRNIPAEVDRALRRAAKEAGTSLNRTTIEILRKALGVVDEPCRKRDLSDLAGTWTEDPELDAALEDQRRIDPEDWR